MSGKKGLSTSQVIIIVLLIILAFVLINWFSIKIFGIDAIDYVLNLASNPPEIGGP